jgi:hypothetical protein
LSDLDGENKEEEAHKQRQGTFEGQHHVGILAGEYQEKEKGRRQVHPEMIH